MMKRFLTIAALLLVSFASAQAQKIGFINSDTILTSIHDYAAAQDSLKKQSAVFQAELEKDLQTIDDLYNKYQNQRQYLSSASCITREQQIISLENELKEKQEKYFGTDGEMAKRSAAALTPIKEKINAVIENYSKENGYSAIIDLAVASGLIYYDKANDITKKIIEKLK